MHRHSRAGGNDELNLIGGKGSYAHAVMNPRGHKNVPTLLDLLAADLALFPRQQIFNIALVPPDQQQRHDA